MYGGSFLETLNLMNNNGILLLNITMVLPVVTVLSEMKLIKICQLKPGSQYDAGASVAS